MSLFQAFVSHRVVFFLLSEYFRWSFLLPHSNILRHFCRNAVLAEITEERFTKGLGTIRSR